MPKLTLTDISVQRLKPGDRQTRYFDASLPGFGILVGKHRKTWFLMKGEDRKIVTLGRYPDMPLKDARLAAMAEKGKALDKWSFDAQRGVQLFLEAAKTRVEPATYGQYEHYLSLFKFKGDVSDLTRTAIRRKLDDLADRPTAQNMAYATLRNFFNWLVACDYIVRSPIAGMEAPNKTSYRDRVLTDEELKAIWKATEPKEGSPGWRKFCRLVRILMCTGQRREEINGLEPEYVSDFLHFPDTKNDFAHTIPVTPLVREHLDMVPFKFNDWNRCKKVLDKKMREHLAAPEKMKPWVIHDLRRTFSTNCARLGVPIHVTEKILNHRSGSFSGVVGIYNKHSYLKEMDDALMAHETHIRKVCEIRNPEPPLPPDERYLGRVTTVLRTS